jgi:hypothetical protein
MCNNDLYEKKKKKVKIRLKKKIKRGNKKKNQKWPIHPRLGSLTPVLTNINMVYYLSFSDLILVATPNCFS